MKLDKTLLALAHSSAATLFPGSRHTPAVLLALFREQHPQVHSPKSLIGMAWLRVGLRPGKSNGTRFWYVPAALSPIEAEQASSMPRPTRAKRRATVDISCLDLKPGDSWCATFTPDAITIRKATA